MIPPIKLPNNGPPLWLQQKLGIPGSALSASVPQALRKSDTVTGTVGRSGGGSSASNRAVRPLVKESPPARVSIDAQSTGTLDTRRAMRYLQKALRTPRAGKE